MHVGDVAMFAYPSQSEYVRRQAFIHPAVSSAVRIRMVIHVEDAVDEIVWLPITVFNLEDDSMLGYYRSNTSPTP